MLVADDSGSVFSLQYPSYCIVTSVVGPNQCFGSGSARIRIKICLLDPDPDPHGQMRIRIPEVNKPRKYTVSLGEYRNGNIKVRILL